MGVCFQSFIYLLCLLNQGTTSQYLPSNAAHGVTNTRERRQAGYVYDRPTISFNLPSRTVDSTSTQATNVDRTLEQQMYYAYPAPAGSSAIKTDYSKTGSAATVSTAASGAAGYNYNNAARNTATGSTGGTTSTITTGSVISGYSYNAGTQNSGSVSTGGITVTTAAAAGGDSDGYRYRGSEQSTTSGSTGGSTSIISTGSGIGSSGYRYGTQNSGSGSSGRRSGSNAGGSSMTINTGGTTSSGYNYEPQSLGNRQIQTSGSSSTISTGGSSGAINTDGGMSSGYNYESQNSGNRQIQIGGSSSTISTGGSSGAVNTGAETSSGYNYESQNSGNRNIQTLTSAVSNLYNVPSNGANTAVSIGISTNAPEYLPPNSVGGSAGVSVTTNSQSGSSSSSVNSPSDTYLPPVQGGESIATQPDENVATVNIDTQTSSAPISRPSTSYLQPSNQQQTSNVQNTQTKVRGQTGGYSSSSVAALSDRYLPPVQGIVSTVTKATQTDGNIAQVNVITQTSGAPITGPSTSYLEPRNQQQTSNIQNTQTVERGQTGGSIQKVPTANYLPPTVNSGTQISVSTPAATYLPPVF